MKKNIDTPRTLASNHPDQALGVDLRFRSEGQDEVLPVERHVLDPEFLEVPVNTVKSYVHRAKGALRKKLSGYLEEPGRTA